MRLLGWFVAGFATAMAVKDELPNIKDKVKKTIKNIKEEYEADKKSTDVENDS